MRRRRLCDVLLEIEDEACVLKIWGLKRGRSPTSNQHWRCVRDEHHPPFH
jgi:hypothetical protein